MTIQTLAFETNAVAPAPRSIAKDCACDACGRRAPDMADLRLYPTEFPITAATTINGNAVRITWSDGVQADFHYIWLRENDPHPDARHPQSRERLIHPLDISPDIQPDRISVHASSALAVRWSKADGGHCSLFHAGWLREHRYGRVEQTAPRSAPRTNRPRPAEVRWDDVMVGDDVMLAWLECYLERGWSIISETPVTEGRAVEFGKRIGTVRASNFGFCFDVRSKADPNSNAYTANYLPLHTDLPHYEMPPGLQILHCLANEAEGGASLLADGLAVADMLRRDEPHVFETLSQTSLAFRFQDTESEFNTRHPIIECNGAGTPVYINWSNSTLAPLDVPFDEMERVQVAIRRFVSLVESPRFLIERKLAAGEMLVFDNRRMLHGRTEFKPATGDRHFQGCYLETAEVLSRRNALARRNPHAKMI